MRRFRRCEARTFSRPGPKGPAIIAMVLSCGGPTREHVKAAQPTIDILPCPRDAGVARRCLLGWLRRIARIRLPAASGARNPTRTKTRGNRKRLSRIRAGHLRTGSNAQFTLDRIDDQASADVVDSGAVTKAAPARCRPCNWVKHDDPRSGQSYYYNILTNETRWEEPADHVEPSSMPAWQPAEGQTAQHGASYADTRRARHSIQTRGDSTILAMAHTGNEWVDQTIARVGRCTTSDISTLENNRKEAEEKKKQLKNVDWRKYKEDRKKRKRLMKERWLHDDWRRSPRAQRGTPAWSAVPARNGGGHTANSRRHSPRRVAFSSARGARERGGAAVLANPACSGRRVPRMTDGAPSARSFRARLCSLSWVAHMPPSSRCALFHASSRPSRLTSAAAHLSSARLASLCSASLSCSSSSGSGHLTRRRNLGAGLVDLRTRNGRGTKLTDKRRRQRRPDRGGFQSSLLDVTLRKYGSLFGRLE